jgi:hypothetical protein
MAAGVTIREADTIWREQGGGSTPAGTSRSIDTATVDGERLDTGDAVGVWAREV